MSEGIIEELRTASRQTKLNNIPADSPEQYHKKSIYLLFLDHFISQLQERFINYYRVMSNNNHLFQIFFKMKLIQKIYEK